MGKKSTSDAIEKIVNETREEFDLGDFLQGRSVRTKTVTAYTDEVTAEKRGGFERMIETLENGVRVPYIRSWGLVKEIGEAKNEYDALESKTTKDAKALKAKITLLEQEIRDLTQKLLDSALEIELRAVPDKIKKGAYRAAREALGIRGKNGVTEDNAIELQDEHAAQILVRTVVSITKVATGEKNQGVSIEGARKLKGLLPDSEWAKVNTAIDELLFEKVIADQVASDLDF
jgi:hypothetical protein